MARFLVSAVDGMGEAELLSSAQLSGSGRKTEIICCENLPAMRIFMRYGVDFNHEAIRGKTPQEKDEQVVASHFPEGDYIRLSFKSKVH